MANNTTSKLTYVGIFVIPGCASLRNGYRDGTKGGLVVLFPK